MQSIGEIYASMVPNWVVEANGQEYFISPPLLAPIVPVLSFLHFILPLIPTLHLVFNFHFQ